MHVILNSKNIEQREEERESGREEVYSLSDAEPESQNLCLTRRIHERQLECVCVCVLMSLFGFETLSIHVYTFSRALQPLHHSFIAALTIQVDACHGRVCLEGVCECSNAFSSDTIVTQIHACDRCVYVENICQHSSAFVFNFVYRQTDRYW